MSVVCIKHCLSNNNENRALNIDWNEQCLNIGHTRGVPVSFGVSWICPPYYMASSCSVRLSSVVETERRSTADDGLQWRTSERPHPESFLLVTTCSSPTVDLPVNTKEFLDYFLLI